MKRKGNIRDNFFINGGRGCGNSERETYDYYATDPITIDYLLKYESFDNNIWECACGEGNLSKRLEEYGFNVRSTDLIYRGYGEKESVNFLYQTEKFDGDIITNPPYKLTNEFVLKALDLTKRKVAMFLKIQFLESQRRYRDIFSKYPPSVIYIFPKRMKCYKNNKPTTYKGGIAFVWIIWDKEYDGETRVRWIDNL